MNSQILLEVDKTDLTIRPGASIEFGVTVQNLTPLLDQVVINLDGISPSWVEVIPSHLPVFPQREAAHGQGKATGRVIIRPPRDRIYSIAGTYPIRVRAISQEKRGQEGVATIALQVELFGDYQVRLGPQKQESFDRASYPIELQNNANAPLQLRFKAHDPHNALLYKFEPFQVVVPAGGEARTTLTVVVNASPNEGRDEQSHRIPFSLKTYGEFLLLGGAKLPASSHQSSGHFTQRPQQLSPRLHLNIRPSHIENELPAQYEIHVGNPTLAALSVQLTALDGTTFDFHFEHSHLTLAPQTSQSVTLVVYPKRQPPPRQREINTFRIIATPSGQKPVEAVATLVLTGKPIAPPNHDFPWKIVLVVSLLLFSICILFIVFII